MKFLVIGEVRDTLCVDERTKELLMWKPKLNLKEWIEEIKWQGLEVL